ncbi:hypothetical protein SAMD00079811_33080 [Scytonema sp. HK-05]|nr:hypothetical protein SAMD00079811_33080 [Scytonema sp. HK-05]
MTGGLVSRRAMGVKAVTSSLTPGKLDVPPDSGSTPPNNQYRACPTVPGISLASIACGLGVDSRPTQKLREYPSGC